MLGFIVEVVVYTTLLLPVYCKFDPVALTFGRDTHQDIQVASGTTIDFSVPITNNGGAVNSGVFTCHKNGLYKVQIFGFTKSDSNMSLELYQNSHIVATLWGHTPGDFAAAGNAVVLPLVSGDTVKVVSRSQPAVNIHGTPGDGIYTTFTVVELGSLSTTGSKLQAFSVSLNVPQDVGKGSAVLYNTIITNVNGAYDVITGEYTVPSKGLYVFHFYSLARQNDELYQDLYQNNQYVCSIYGKPSQAWSNAGNTVLLPLIQNDKITIRARSNNVIYGTAVQIYSTFSGSQLVTDKDMEQETVVAFSVGLSQDATVSSGSKVMFDKVFIDLNHAYELSLGEFIAPVSGYYEFNYHALGMFNDEIRLDLYRNYKYINSLYSHTPNNYATAGNAAVIELNAGDRVFVEAYGDAELFGANDQVYCTFTGYLLYAKPSPAIVG